MRILITGATGFLGAYLIQECQRQGHDPLAFGRNRQVGEQLSCPFIQGDLVDEQIVDRAVASVDAVIHAGALSTVWGPWEAFRQANVLGSQNIAQACLKHQIQRLVFISSPSVYTGKKDLLDISESYLAPRPMNHYIRSKRVAEKIIKTYNAQGLDTVILRPRGLFGIGDTSIIPRLLMANQESGIPFFHEGKNLVDVTQVENVALACLLAVEAQDISGETFNITNDQPMAFRDILEQLLEKIGSQPKYLPLSFPLAYGLATLLEGMYQTLRLQGEPRLTRYIVATLGTSQTLNIDKAKKKLGYIPRITIEEGIDNYAAWWRKNKTS